MWLPEVQKLSLLYVIQVGCPPSRIPQICKRYFLALHVEDEEVKKLLAYSVKSKMKVAPKRRESGAKDTTVAAWASSHSWLKWYWLRLKAAASLLQVEDEEVKKLLASSVKSKKKNKPKKKKGVVKDANGAAGGAEPQNDAEELLKAKEEEEAREGIRAL